jgi:hypothetical protein
MWIVASPCWERQRDNEEEVEVEVEEGGLNAGSSALERKHLDGSGRRISNFFNSSSCNSKSKSKYLVAVTKQQYPK